jgi:acyl-CoA dehydrogenase
MRTTATWSADGWTISGQKRFITNAPLADVFVTFAKVRGTAAEGKIAVFLIPAGSHGLTVGPKDQKMGQQGATTADVYFDQVRVGHEALVSGEVETGFRAAMTVLARGRVHISALAAGLAERALEESVVYSAQNRQGGVPTGDRQLVQAMLAEQQALVMASKALTREAARNYVDGTDRRIGPSAAKLFCTEAAGRVADLAVQVHGGSGYMREVAVERIYRDARLLRLYEGTSEIQKLIIGRELMRQQKTHQG